MWRSRPGCTCVYQAGASGERGSSMTVSTNTISYEVRDHRAYITLDRPDRLNAITAEMGREIAAAVAAANADDGVRVIIVQGAGRAFSTGYDLKLYAEQG